MTAIGVVTAGGSVEIPRELRDALSLETGTVLVMERMEGGLLLRPLSTESNDDERNKRIPGALQGQVWIADDFDAPALTSTCTSRR